MANQTKTLAAWFAHYLVAKQNCFANGNAEWYQKHGDALRRLNAFLPSGSGVGNGSYLDQLRSGRDVLRFCTSFHHMDEHGCYDGWTDHVVSVRPMFEGLDITSVTGRDRNDIKEHLAVLFLEALQLEVTQDSDGKFYCQAWRDAAGLPQARAV